MTKSVWSKLNDEKTINILRRLIETPSPTGSEAPAAELLAEIMEGHGVEVNLQEVEEGRPNVIGVVRGDGSGPRLLFNGHLDTSFTGNFKEDFAMAGELAHLMKAKATVENGMVYGLGARNMKGGVAAMTAALCALADSGISLRGDVVAAGVVGEIERTSVQGLLHDYKGKAYRGCGIGMKHLLEHGFTADFSITAEPTSNVVVRAKPGFMYLRLMTKGTTAYAPFKAAGLGDNALIKMAKIVTAIEEEFAPAFTKSHVYDLGQEYGRLEPQVNVGGIEAGYPFKPNYVPAICYSYVDVFFTPKMNVKQVTDELRTFLEEKGMCADIEPYLIKGPPGETQPDHYLVKTCKSIYEKVTGRKHVPPPPSKQSISDDSTTTRLFGISSITWGPAAVPDPKAVGKGEYVSVEEVVTAAKLYAAAIVEICSKKREETF